MKKKIKQKKQRVNKIVAIKNKKARPSFDRVAVIKGSSEIKRSF